MISPNGFPSWSSYFQFGLAREFAPANSSETVKIAKNRLEKLGELLSRPILKPFNFFLREIRNPLVILSLTVTLVALATLLFYPAQLMLAVSTLLPFLGGIQPWMAKLAFFGLVEVTVAGIGLRAFGRMCNSQLRRAWEQRQIIPVHLGAKKII